MLLPSTLSPPTPHLPHHGTRQLGHHAPSPPRPQDACRTQGIHLADLTPSPPGWSLDAFFPCRRVVHPCPLRLTLLATVQVQELSVKHTSRQDLKGEEPGREGVRGHVVAV